MAHFYGSVEGSRGAATRLGTANSGMVTVAANWSGAVRVTLECRDGVDIALVELVPWNGHGTTRQLYHGSVSGLPLSESPPMPTNPQADLAEVAPNLFAPEG